MKVNPMIERDYLLLGVMGTLSVTQITGYA